MTGSDTDRRVAVVTGGGKGIGLAVSTALADQGFDVVVLGRDMEALRAAEQITGFIRGIVCDVTEEAAVDSVFDHIGDVDILVNNAGISSSAALPRTTLADWETQMRVNATGPFLCTRAVLDGMRRRDFGRIVTIASIASHLGAPYVAAYTASKHAVLGLMRSVAAEVSGTGVTANCVCPAFVRTAMTERSVASIVARTGREPEQAEAALVAFSKLGRLVEPAEVAAAVVYLTSDGAAAVNGQSIILDGGGVQQ